MNSMGIDIFWPAKNTALIDEAYLDNMSVNGE